MSMTSAYYVFIFNSTTNWYSAVQTQYDSNAQLMLYVVSFCLHQIFASGIRIAKINTRVKMQSVCPSKAR